MMKAIFLTLVSLLAFNFLSAQQVKDGKSLISSIEKNGWDKSEMISAMERVLLKITQEDFPDWKVSEVNINPRTGEMTIKGKNEKGQTFMYGGAEFGKKLSSPSYKPKTARSTTSYGAFECLRRRLSGLSCDPWIDAGDMSIPTSHLDPVEKECRKRLLSMLYD